MYFKSDVGDILVIIHANKRKTIRIAIKHNTESGEIEIHLYGPKLKPNNDIKVYDANYYLDKYKDWLNKKINKLYNDNNFALYKDILDLKVFYIYGKCFNVIFTDSINLHLKIEGDNLYYYKGPNTSIDYKRFALNIRSNYTSKVIDLFNKYQEIFNKQTILRFSNLKNSYGYLEPSKNRMTISYRVVSLPIDLIEYVIIHEFCHYKYLNHQKEFYNEVLKYCKDYKTRVSLLKKLYAISR